MNPITRYLQRKREQAFEARVLLFLRKHANNLYTEDDLFDWSAMTSYAHPAIITAVARGDMQTARTLTNYTVLYCLKFVTKYAIWPGLYYEPMAEVGKRNGAFVVVLSNLTYYARNFNRETYPYRDFWNNYNHFLQVYQPGADIVPLMHDHFSLWKWGPLNGWEYDTVHSYIGHPDQLDPTQEGPYTLHIIDKVPPFTIGPLTTSENGFQVVSTPDVWETGNTCEDCGGPTLTYDVEAFCPACDIMDDSGPYR